VQHRNRMLAREEYIEYSQDVRLSKMQHVQCYTCLSKPRPTEDVISIFFGWYTLYASRVASSVVNDSAAYFDMKANISSGGQDELRRTRGATSQEETIF
jgi:hypothetical protein